MKYILYYLSLFVFSSFSSYSQTSDKISSPRKVIDFDFDWRFKLGDFKNAYTHDFNDKDWKKLNLPHDWSIEGAYDSINPSGTAGAFLPTGIGWYRKNFNYLKKGEDKKVSIQFDGIYKNSTVWINGIKLGTRPNGYIGFSYNLTPYLKNGKNVISVKVNHSKAPSGRWYTGSGIYRHVKLLITKKIYIPKRDVFISTPKVKSKEATIKIELSIKNELNNTEKVKVSYHIFDNKNKKINQFSENIILQKGTNSFKNHIVLLKPELWSPSNPYLYNLQVTIEKGTKIIDQYNNTFGVRSISFSAKNGFELNGVQTILKGVCLHHDAGPVGTAVPDDVLLRRLKILKKMGCNAIRTSHTPFAPEFYDMCDSLGFLVMDESFDGWEVAKAKYDYGLNFEKWWKTDLEDFIKRDRNHPSVIIWSIGNEVRGYTDKTQQKLVDFIKSIDTTRPISQGRGYYGEAIDVAGFNGHGEYKGSLDKFHNKHPDKPIIGTEITHNYQTRGVYRSKTSYRIRDFPAPWEKKQIAKGKGFNSIKEKIYLVDDLTEKEVFTDVNPIYQSSYDNSIVRMGIRDYWKATKNLPYFLGAFRWTGFDYLGESFGWPARTMNFGVIDLAGFPTDNYYLYQSLWTEKPMVHMLPHWTHQNKENVEIPVVIYTNCESAELFLNGKSLGEKPMTDDLQIVWKVPYTKGKLKVVAKNKGQKVIRKIYQTAGEPYTVKILLDRQSILANQKAIIHAEILIVDKNGIEVPSANNLLIFELEGAGKLIGVENGDIIDLSPHKINYRKAFNGKCLGIIQSNGLQGDIKLKIKSKGLKSQTINITAH